MAACALGFDSSLTHEHGHDIHHGSPVIVLWKNQILEHYHHSYDSDHGLIVIFSMEKGPNHHGDDNNHISAVILSVEKLDFWIADHHGLVMNLYVYKSSNCYEHDGNHDSTVILFMEASSA